MILPGSINEQRRKGKTMGNFCYHKRRRPTEGGNLATEPCLADSANGGRHGGRNAGTGLASAKEKPSDDRSLSLGDASSPASRRIIKLAN